MKKVVATVLHRENTIVNLTANHKGNLIPLITIDDNITCNSHIELYKTVIAYLKNNNMYVGQYTEFGTTFYDIQFIDLNYPYGICKYGIQ